MLQSSTAEYLGVSYLLHPMLNNMHLLLHSRPSPRKYRRGIYGQLISVRSALDEVHQRHPTDIVKDLERTSICAEIEIAANVLTCHVGVSNHIGVMELDMCFEQMNDGMFYGKWSVSP